MRMRGETDGLPKVGAGGSRSGSDMSAVWHRVSVYRTRSRSSASGARCNGDIIRDKCKFNGEKPPFPRSIAHVCLRDGSIQACPHKKNADMDPHFGVSLGILTHLVDPDVVV